MKFRILFLALISNCITPFHSDAKENLSPTEHVIKGQKQFFDLNMDAAITHFKSAQEEQYEHFDQLADGENLVQAHLYLALCYHSQQKLDLARAEIRSAYVLNPEKKLDEKKFSPAFMTFVQQTIETLKPTLKFYPLEVHSNPPFAKVWINGFPMGVTPLILQSWPQGRHVIRLALEGYASWSKLISASQPSSQKIKAQLKADDPLRWVLQKPISQNTPPPPKESLRFQAQNLPEYRASSSGWLWWPVLAAAAGGIAYGIYHHQHRKEAETTPKTSIQIQWP
ncbi:MAG: PEGA domain-containing protein [Deltaproteobacteria bacterium]|nr:PEGA domain-containing protein [Deltaproteobacteria bacterium]